MKPFDLKAAQAGKPLITSMGKPCSFVAHVPEAKHNDRVVLLLDGEIYTCAENGDDTPPFYGQGATYNDWTVGMAAETHVRYTTLYGFRTGSMVPIDTMRRLKTLAHDTPEESVNCSGCKVSDSNPILRIEWQE